LAEHALYLAAGTRILTDPARQLPTGTEPVGGTPFDFRNGRLLGGLQVDHALTGLAHDESGRAWARLARPDGYTAELWVDQSYPVIEIYTGDTAPPGRRRRGAGHGADDLPAQRPADRRERDPPRTRAGRSPLPGARG
jgi:aldose 1-epimerase